MDRRQAEHLGSLGVDTYYTGARSLLLWSRLAEILHKRLVTQLVRSHAMLASDLGPAFKIMQHAYNNQVAAYMINGLQ